VPLLSNNKKVEYYTS